jgi:hypothetical protein
MWRSHENQEIKLEVVQQTDNYREREEQSGWGSKVFRSRDI